MIKCPQCLQPRDDLKNPCPHCGEEPYGVGRSVRKIADAPSPPRPREAPGKRVAAPGPGGFSGADIDLGDAGDVSLDLADDWRAEAPSAAEPPDAAAGAPPPVASARSTPPPAGRMDIGAEEVRRVAAYGEAPSGFPRAALYWWRVLQRRSELNGLRAKAAEGLAEAEEKRTALLAELGRAAEAGLAGDGAATRLLDAARTADARRDDEARRAAAAEAEQAARVAEFKGRSAALGSELAPLDEREEETRRALDEIRTEARRTEAAMKRSEIERRNLVELIGKRQEAFADLTRPQEERSRLLAEISELDARHPELNARVDDARAKLATFDAPLAEAQAAFVEASARTSEKRAAIEAIREEIALAEQSFGAERRRSGERIDAGDKDAQSAWAAVGARALPGLDRRGEAPAASLARSADSVGTRVAAASREVALLERAVTSYDEGVFARGRVVAIAAGSLVLLLVAIALAVGLS